MEKNKIYGFTAFEARTAVAGAPADPGRMDGVAAADVADALEEDGWEDAEEAAWHAADGHPDSQPYDGCANV